MPAHFLGLPDVTQNLPIMLLQLDAWKFSIPRTLQLLHLVECLASVRPSPTTPVGALSCRAGRRSLDIRAQLYGGTETCQVGAKEMTTALRK